MRAVITRVSSASVAVDGACVGAIKQGLLVLLGVGPDDTPQASKRLAEKITRLRIFSDPAGKMNLDLAAVQGGLLVVSQFTLFANTKSRRPGFTDAAPPTLAEALYQQFLEDCAALGHAPAAGSFGAHMEVSSVNDGPVTIWLDTDSM